MWTGRPIFLSLALATLTASAADGYRQTDDPPRFPLTGVVLLQRPGDRYFFMQADDGSGAWRIERESDVTRLHSGACVTVTNGVWRPEFTTRRINHAGPVVVRSEEGPLPPPESVTLEELYRHPVADPSAPDRLFRRVVCEGDVIDINRRQTFTQIQVSDGARSVQIPVHFPITTALPEDLGLGARLRVTGVLLYTPVDDRDRHVMTDFSDVTVMPTGPSEVEIVSAPPFWTPGRIWTLTGLCVCGLALVLSWVALLRRAVARQTARLERTIREKHTARIEFDAIRRERLRLSYELHDNFQQLIASTQFRLEAAALSIGKNDDKVRTQVEKAQDTLVYTQQQLRAALWGMNEESEGPGSFTGLLRYAVGRMAHWQGVVEVVSHGEEPAGARKFSGALLMILQEAVGNSLKAGARKVRVALSFTEGTLTMRLVDDGFGFDVAAPVGAEHLGLRSMKRRAEELGGTFRIDSVLGKGTTLTVEVKT